MAKFDFSNSHPVGGDFIGFSTFVNGKLVHMQHETVVKPKVQTIDATNLPIAPIQWDFPDIEISVFNEILVAFFVDDPHIAVASPKRWHVRQKRATCLRLKARDA